MIAIHYSKGSFSERWISYCDQNNISYKIVNCYDDQIISQLSGCNSLMWHFSQNNPKDILVAKSILFSLENAGMKVFPNYHTSWHFDDKLAQKYLLEAAGLNIVKTWAFYDKSIALNWAKDTNYPVVFKLKGGAGSQNVKLVRNFSQARKLINTAFSNGFSNYDAIGNLKERFRKWNLGMVGFYEVIKGFIRLIFPPPYSKVKGKEYGYAYFQQFIPNNDSDIRIIVVFGKAFAIKRMVRENDFRASGSGNIIYDKSQIDIRCVEAAMESSKILKGQSLAYDYVFDSNNNPQLIEISYGFALSAYDNCEGYWDEQLIWNPGKFNPYGWMVENLNVNGNL